ncbi:MAG: hypothetical protein ACJ72X_09555 [Nitrososphaeraceae archaeon]
MEKWNAFLKTLMGNGTFELSYGTAESSTMEKRLRTCLGGQKKKRTTLRY